jgi:hypothetical protein
MPIWKAPASWTKWVWRPKSTASANELGQSRAHTPATTMDSPANKVTASTNRRLGAGRGPVGACRTGPTGVLARQRMAAVPPRSQSFWSRQAARSARAAT